METKWILSEKKKRKRGNLFYLHLFFMSSTSLYMLIVYNRTKDGVILLFRKLEDTTRAKSTLEQTKIDLDAKLRSLQ